MKIIEKIKNHGISLLWFNRCMFLFAIITTLVLFWAMKQTTDVYHETHEVTQRLITWRQNAYDLQLASDYLTEQIRSFVVTGDRTYLDNYFEEADVTKRRENALDVLDQRLEKSTAYVDLSKAMDESVALMQTEFYAARLAVAAYGYDIAEFPEAVRNVELKDADAKLSPEQQKIAAESLLFGEEYRKSKDMISAHMQQCMAEIAELLEQDQHTLSDRLRNRVLWEHIYTDILIVIVFGIVLLTSRLVILPMQRAVELIRSEENIPIRGACELRFLAKSYNLMNRSNQQSKEKLTYEATHDKLTGLYNRRGYEVLVKTVDLETSALMLIDLDKFKEVNDTYGHDIGDKVLKKVSNALFGSFRSQDYICRIGGDEMAVIMVHSDESLKKLLEKKVDNINKRLMKGNSSEGVPAVSVSVGVAFGEKGIDHETMFKRADASLYEAKNGGRSDICFYEGEEA